MKFSLQKQSRLILSSLAMLTVFFGMQSANIQAQSAGFEAGLAGQMSNVLGTGIISNAVGENAVNNAIKNRGMAIIKSGRANTTFTHSPDIYSDVVSTLTFDPDEPQTKPEQIIYTRDQVKRFEARMLKAGNYKLNDIGDAASFACLLSYEARYDKKQLTPAEAEIFARYRQETRQMLLNYAMFQGSTDQFKENMYIMDAIMGLQAIEMREKARLARTSVERYKANERVNQYAEYKMKLFTDEELQELMQAEQQVK